VIDKNSFTEAVEDIVTKEYEENRKYLESLKFFPFLPSDTKDLISASLVTLKYYKNQTIVEEGDPGSAFYIIKEGVASLIKGTVEQRKMYRGESFGEMSLYYNTMRRMTVKAEDDVKCLVLGRETLAKILGESFHSTMFKNFIRYSFQKNRSLARLPKVQQ
jgi:cGMP-dependent protein kinase